MDMVLAALLEKLEYELVSGSEDMQIENVVYDLSLIHI